MLVIKLFILTFLVANALARADAVGASRGGTANCTEFNDYASYNDTLQKCVLPLYYRCDASWPAEVQQCGAGKGGVCFRGSCTCRTYDYAIIHSLPEKSQELGQDGRVPILDYACLPRAAFGESCVANTAFGGDNCQLTLRCVNSTCACVGDWDDDALSCRNDVWCSYRPTADGLNLAWFDAFYEKSTGLCKCEVSGPCMEDLDGNPGRCPLNAKMETDSEGERHCKCQQGFTHLKMDEELRQRNPSLPDTVCVPLGRPGQPCARTRGNWWETGTCLPTLRCGGDVDDRVCECDGDWSEADDYCYSGKTCSDSLVRDKYESTWRVFYKNGSMLCTCGLGAPCPWATPTADSGATPRFAPLVACPRNASLVPANDKDTQPSCMCHSELAHTNGWTECAEKPRYGERCENLPYSGRQANPCADGATCDDEKCTCPYGRTWVPAKGRCVPYEGSTCTTEEGCFGGAECNAIGRCECLPGFYWAQALVGPSLVPVCRPEGKPGARCFSDADCKYFTECVGRSYQLGECACQGGWNEAESMCHNDAYCRDLIGNGASYDEGSGLCLCLIGPTCSSGAVQPENCPPGATPTDAGDACECNVGHTPLNGGRQCGPIRAHGEKCEYEDPKYLNMAMSRPGQCLNGSWCHGGVCKCSGGTDRWDDAIQWCVVKAGEVCEESREICTHNTKCLNGRCNCPEAEGYRSTPTGECFGEHGAACQNNGNCSLGFDCMDGQCACRSIAGQVYSAEGAMCVSLVGAHCDPVTDGPCAVGSTCDSATRTCRCQEDQVPAQNYGRCFKALKYGDNCAENDCDPSRGLACDGQGRCVCADLDLIHHEGQGACLASVGSRCGEYEVAGSCLPVAGAQRADCEYYTLACESGLECSAEGKSGAMWCQNVTATATGSVDPGPTAN